MYPNEFDYYEATSVEEALDLLEEHGDQNTELLAGGHSLIPTMKSGLADPDVLVDISGVESMQGIEDEGDSVSIGAMTKYADIAESDVVEAAAPALRHATEQVGDKQVRNRGTIGGNLAHADPASDLPGAAIAADATIVVQGADGKRRVDAEEFFMGMYMTDVGHDELVVRVEVPATGEDTVGAYAKKPSPSSGYAMVGVAATLTVADGAVENARVGANGAMDHGVRLGPVEDAIEGDDLTSERIENAASHATDDLDVDMMMDDLQASGDFRAQLLEVYTRRALEAAAERASAAAPAAD
ncbi:MAG: xanthine dehydrogenase family protein subunit M [Haloarculaceae archaeon]